MNKYIPSGISLFIFKVRKSVSKKPQLFLTKHIKKKVEKVEKVEKFDIKKSFLNIKKLTQYRTF
jgi:transcription antitermination factor NusA-like protein